MSRPDEERVSGGPSAASLLVVRTRWSDANALQGLPGSIVLAAVAVLARSVPVVLPIRLVYDVIAFLSGDAGDYRTPADPVDVHERPGLRSWGTNDGVWPARSS